MATEVFFCEGFGWAPTGVQVDASNNPLKMRYSSWGANADPELTDLADPDGERKYVSPDANGRVNLVPRATWAGQTTIAVGFRIWHEGFGETLFALFDGPTKLGHIAINPSGNIVYSTDNGGRYDQGRVAVSTGAVPTSTLTYVELEIVFDGATGSVDIHIGGTLDSQTTGEDTIEGGTSCTRIEVLWGASGLDADEPTSTVRLTDIYVAAAILGPTLCYYWPADAAGSAANHTPNAGTNHEAVDDLDGHDSDTTYVEGSGDKDSLGVSETTTDVVLAVQAIAAAKGVGGTAGVQVGVLSGATEALGPSTGLPTSYEGAESAVHHHDPDTATDWVSADVGDAEVVLQS